MLPYQVEAEPDNRQQTPWLVYSFLALFLLVFVYTGMTLSEEARHDVFCRFGMVRYDYHWWTAFTCTLLHGGILHFAGNAFFFWIFGASLERLLGTGRFLALYLVGAFLSVNIHVLTVSPLFVDEPCIGASGATSAVLGCFFVMLPRAKLRCLFFSPISFRPIHVLAPAWLVLGLWFGYQLFFTLGMFGHMVGIAFWAHVAGFAAGAAMGTIFNQARKKRLAKWAAEVKQPLADAWQAYIDQNPEKAAAQLENAGEIHPDARPIHSLLTGLLKFSQQADPDLAAPGLLRTFRQARDYRDEFLQFTVYLQMIRKLPPESIPGIIHREAGFAALAQKEDKLALWAFCQSVTQNVDERLEQMLRALELMFETRLDLPQQAEAIRQIRQQLSS